jgi:hypothetical protein
MSTKNVNDFNLAELGVKISATLKTAEAKIRAAMDKTLSADYQKGVALQQDAEQKPSKKQ